MEYWGPVARRARNPAAIAVSRTKCQHRRPAPFCTPYSVGDGGDTTWATFLLGGIGGGAQAHEANVDDVTVHLTPVRKSKSRRERLAARGGPPECRPRPVSAADGRRARRQRARAIFATPPTGRRCRWAPAVTLATRAAASTAAVVTACPILTHTAAVWRLGPTAGRASL